jgi:UDP-GlcNAc:undecaprenyl-phosphate GlcNAc-1-phosphate transferase
MSLSAFLTHFVFGSVIFLLSLILTHLMLRRLVIIDIPNERSSHFSPTPKSGGISIVISFFVGILAIYLFGDKTPITQKYFIGFMTSVLIISAVSFYDDIKNKPFVVKLYTQIAAAIVAITFGIVQDVISIPLVGYVNLGWWAYPLTVLWIVGLTNVFNFMDGIDGLAGGTALITSLFFSYICFSQGSTFIYITCNVLFAGTLGFMVFNFPPAKIFMGDIGSAFLGFVFATMAIIAARYDHSHTSFFVIPLLLFHFIFDTSFTFIRRLINKENVVEAHRTHLYQLCNRLGLSHKSVSFIQYSMCIIQGFGALTMIHMVGEKRLLIFIPFFIVQSIYAFVVYTKSKELKFI